MDPASLAIGVVALVGQSITGIQKLKSFFDAYKSAAAKVKALNAELDSLSSTLDDVRVVVSRQPTETKTLKERLERCRADIDAWNTASKTLDLNLSGDLKVFRRKIKIATKQDLFDEIASIVSSHRQAIGNCLTALNLSVSCDALALNKDISSQFRDLTSTNLTLLDASKATHDAVEVSHQGIISSLQYFHTETTQNHADQMDYMRSIADSLSTIASSISSHSVAHANVQRKPLRLLSSTSPPPPPHRGLFDSPSSPSDTFYSCSAVVGIDELFMGSGTCYFCSLSSTTDSHLPRFIDASAFGKHLVDDHNFGACNSSREYATADEFARHIFRFHCRTSPSHSVGTYLLGQFVRAKLNLFACQGMGHDSGDDDDDPPPDVSYATASLLETQIRQIVEDPHVVHGDNCSDSAKELVKPRTGESGRDSWALTAEARALSRGLLSLQKSAENGSVEPAALYRASCLIEELLVSELDSELPPHFLESTCHEALARGALEVFGDCACLEKGLGRYREGWFVMKRINVVSGPGCVVCKPTRKMNTAFCSLDEVRAHLKEIHGMPDGALRYFEQAGVRMVPIGVKPCCFPQMAPEASQYGYIDHWMLHCFLESPNWRILFRTFANPRQPFDSPMGVWAVEVLSHWATKNGDGYTPEIIAPTDGAVNSLDDSHGGGGRQWSIHFGMGRTENDALIKSARHHDQSHDVHWRTIGPQKDVIPPTDPGRDQVFACVFYKRDPTRFYGCFEFHFKGIRAVKRHLILRHNRKGKRRDLTSAQLVSLRAMDYSDLSPEEQWYRIWEIVYPDTHPPESPYQPSPLQHALFTTWSLWDTHRSKIASLITQRKSQQATSSENGVIELIDDMFDSLRRETAMAEQSLKAREGDTIAELGTSRGRKRKRSREGSVSGITEL